jgi:lysophospholipase L1-like esterase
MDAARHDQRVVLSRLLAMTVLLAVLGALLVGCQAPLPGSVRGTVRGPDGAALGGMDVALHRGNADPTPLAVLETADDGTYDFGVLNGGNYRLGVTDPSHVYLDYWHATADSLATSTVILVDGSAATVDVTMSTVSTHGTLGGVVRSGADPAGLGSITVALFNAAAANPLATTTTAEDGSYHFTDLEPAAYKVGFVDPAQVYAPQFAGGALGLADAAPVVVAPRAHATVDVALARAGRIAGVVTDGVTGVGGIWVKLASESSPGFYQAALTGSDGRFTLAGLAPATYLIGVQDPAFEADPTRGFRTASFGTPGRIDLAGATRFVVGEGATVTADTVLLGAACDPTTFHHGAMLDGATIAGSRMSACDLSASSLRNLAAARADLHGADLRGADLRGADLSRADLRSARLDAADLTGADLSGAKLAGVTWSGATCPSGVPVGSGSCGKIAAVVQATIDTAPAFAGRPLAFTVTVQAPAPGAPVPAGQVTVVGAGTTEPLVGGRATGTLVMPQSGDHTVELEYSGDATYDLLGVTVPIHVEPGLVPYTGTGPTVAMLGDSVTFWSSSTIGPALGAAGFRSSVSGIQGLTTLDATWAVDHYAAAPPDVLVIELGTNDVSYMARGLPGYTMAEVQARLTALAARFPTSCVVVSTVSAHRSAAWRPEWQTYNERAVELDAWLHATFPHVLEWEQAVADALANGSTILVDEVHPNDAGIAVMAQLTAGAVASCVGS